MRTAFGNDPGQKMVRMADPTRRPPNRSTESHEPCHAWE